MDAATLVTDLLPEGLAFVDELTARGVRLDAAFWGQLNDDYRPYLYVVSPDFETTGPQVLAANIRRTITALRDGQPPALSMLVLGDVQMLPPDDETARRVAAMVRAHTGRGPIRSPIEGLYIYPLPAPAPAA